jgi:hypothetical protein
VRYCYRPFDVRWLYWEPETKLLDEKRPEYFPHVFAGNIWLVSQQKTRREWSRPQVISSLGCLDLMDRGASCIPLYLKPQTLFDQADSGDKVLNLSKQARAYLEQLGSLDDAPHLFYHTVAMLHAPAYRSENAGALRQDWPRIPLPASREALLHSAELGRQVAALLDPEQPVSGVTSGSIRPELKAIGVLTTASGGQINTSAGDLELRAGWGYAGRGGITMPGRGRAVQRAYAPAEQAQLGAATFDISLNDAVYWRNIPEAVWQYTLGGYQVIKKWLSYRELPLLGRSLSVDEARQVTQIARRIAAILLLEPELDASYTAVKAGGYRMEGEGEE